MMLLVQLPVVAAVDSAYYALVALRHLPAAVQPSSPRLGVASITMHYGCGCVGASLRDAHSVCSAADL
jgi:hypothetical protein